MQNEYLSEEYWESLWQSQYDYRQSMYSGENGLGYWENRADDFSEMRESFDYEYGKSVYSTLQSVIPDSAKVFDIGAGPGTFLIPFAPYIEKFVALEPAQGMIANLKRNAKSSGVENYDVIASTWEDLNNNLHVSCYDLVLISITLWMFRDIRQSILNMEHLSRGYCCVITGAGKDPSGHGNELWNKIMGDCPKPSYSEFPFIFNMLYAMGRRPEVRMISHKGKRSIESRIRQQELFYAKYTELDESKKQVIREHVLDSASKNGGVSLEEYNSAVVYWKV